MPVGGEFHKNGKKAFGLKFTNTDSFMSSIGFMVPLDDYKGKLGQRFIYKGIAGRMKNPSTIKII